MLVYCGWLLKGISLQQPYRETEKIESIKLMQELSTLEYILYKGCYRIVMWLGFSITLKWFIAYYCLLYSYLVSANLVSANGFKIYLKSEKINMWCNQYFLCINLWIWYKNASHSLNGSLHNRIHSAKCSAHHTLARKGKTNYKVKWFREEGLKKAKTSPFRGVSYGGGIHYREQHW